MSNKKLFYNKTAKGLASMLVVVILLSSVLAVTFFSQNENNITAGVAANSNAKFSIEKVENINELKQLNEGWYRITNGNVFYLEHFDSEIPLYIKIKNPANLNGLMVIDKDGNINFDEDGWKLIDKEKNIPEENKEEIKAKENNLVTGNAVGIENKKLNENKISGEVTGLEGVSGMQTAQPSPPQKTVSQIQFENLKRLEGRYGAMTRNPQDGSYKFEKYTGKAYVQSDGSVFLSGGVATIDNGEYRETPDTYNGDWTGRKTPIESYIPLRTDVTVTLSNSKKTQKLYLEKGKWYLDDSFIPYRDSKILPYRDINMYIYDKYGGTVTKVYTGYTDTTNPSESTQDYWDASEFRTYIAESYIKETRSNKNPFVVLRLAKQAADANPPNSFTLGSIGNIYYQYGQKDEAIGFYQKAFQAQPDSRFYAIRLNLARRNSIEGWTYNEKTQSYNPPTLTSQAQSVRDSNSIAIGGGLSYSSDRGCTVKEGSPGCFFLKPDGSIYYDGDGGNNPQHPAQTVVNGNSYRVDNKQEITSLDAKISFTPQERARKQYVGADGTLADNLRNNIGLGNMFSDETLYLTKDGGVMVLTKNRRDGKYYDSSGTYAAVRGGEKVSATPPAAEPETPNEELINQVRQATSQEFTAKVKKIAADNGWDETALLQSMNFESVGTFSPSKRNPISGATGLIQFTEKTAIDLGTTTSALARMTAVEQLDWVEKYFKKQKEAGKDLSDGDELMASVISQASVGQPPEYTMFRRGSKEYSQNAGLDKNNDGTITREEYLNAVKGYTGTAGAAQAAPTFSYWSTTDGLLVPVESHNDPSIIYYREQNKKMFAVLNGVEIEIDPATYSPNPIPDTLQLTDPNFKKKKELYNEQLKIFGLQRRWLSAGDNTRAAALERLNEEIERSRMSKDPDRIVKIFVSDDSTPQQKKIAEDLLRKGSDNADIMEALANLDTEKSRQLFMDIVIANRDKKIPALESAMDKLSEVDKSKLNAVLENYRDAKAAGVEYDAVQDKFFKNGVVYQINSVDLRGNPIATPTADKYAPAAGTPAAQAAKIESDIEKQLTEQGYTITADRKIVKDNNEYSGVLLVNRNPDGTKTYTVDTSNKKPLQEITINEGKTKLTKTTEDYRTTELGMVVNENAFGEKNYQIIGAGLAVYRDPAGKLYDQQGNPLAEGRGITLAKDLNQNVVEKFYFKVKNGGIDSKNIDRVMINNVDVPVRLHGEIENLIAQAKKEGGDAATITGKFTADDPFIISNGKNPVASLYSFANPEGVQNIDGISTGTRRERNIENGKDIVTVSQDGSSNVHEIKQYAKDQNGKTTTNLVTTSWKKSEKDENGNNYLTTRTYSINEDGTQSKGFTELKKNALTGEPISSRTLDDKNLFYYQRKSQGDPMGSGNLIVSIDAKTGRVSLELLNANGNIIPQESIQYISNKDCVKDCVVQLQYQNLDEFKKSDIWKNMPNAAKKDLEDKNSEHKKWTSRRAFANFEKVFTEYRGLGYIPSLFGFSDAKFLEDWRGAVDKNFAKYLGTEYFVSKICTKSTNIQQDGIAFADTPQGLLQVGAHIEATRTEPIVDEKNRVSFIYKITFNVRNGDFDKDLKAPENMSVNLIIKGFDGVTFEDIKKAQPNTALPKKKIILYKQDINIGRGSTFGKMGSSAIVKSSTTLYTEICLTFDKIPQKWKIDKKENGRFVLCNRIQESPGEPTEVKTGTSASPTGSDAQLNDF